VGGPLGINANVSELWYSLADHVPIVTCATVEVEAIVLVSILKPFCVPDVVLTFAESVQVAGG
jgi:hypothetical protein